MDWIKKNEEINTKVLINKWKQYKIIQDVKDYETRIRNMQIYLAEHIK